MREGFLRFRLGNRNSYKLHILKIKILSFLPSAIIGSVALFFLISAFLFFWYSRDLPVPDKVQRREGFSTVIVDRNSKPIYDIYTDKNRIPVTLSDIPDVLKKATVAIEDKEFYKHQGFDLKGMLRAFFNILTLRGLQGGSTLTQQLVKNVLLSSERTLPRKIKEFVLAVQIERKYSKDEILQMYLNEAPYGGTMWGIESAAQGYFGKSVRDLTLTESVILAGLPQRPSYYSPFSGNPTAFKSRSEEVLRRMREDGYLSPDKEYEIKKDLSYIKFATPGANFVAPHFVFYVKKLLVEMLGESILGKGGLTITTTLDSDLQKKSETIVREELDKLKGLNVENGATLGINPQNGEILFYVGSKYYDAEEENQDFQGKFDIVTQALRQPGSALKPIMYAASFSKGYTPATLLMDTETHFPGGEGKPDYIPKNYDGKYRGPVQIRFALGNSINIPAVKMTAMVGIHEILKISYDMGLSTLAPNSENEKRLGLSLVLGGGEVRLIDLVQSYGVFATGGIKNDLVSILKVTDSSGKILYEYKKKSGKRVLNEDISYLISNILSDNKAREEIFGPRSYLVIPEHTVAVKTGTTDDKKDNWTIGYTNEAVVGVWVGNNDNSPMNPRLSSGATGAAPIWNRLMREALKGKSDEPFKIPDNILSIEIDAFSGGLPVSGKPTRIEYFIKGSEPTSVSSIYQKLKLSKKENGKLANQVEIAQGNYDEKDFVVFKEEDPTSRDEKNLWQEGIDKWLETQSDPAYHSPKETSKTDENSVVIRIKKPQDKEKIDSNDIEILADAKALREIKKIELYADDNLKKSVDGNILNETIHLDTGVHKIKIKAYDSENHTGESEVTIGVKTSAEPTLTPSPSSIMTVTPTP
jgi:penicillin-binding protein 1C